jgi:long-subunit fatty acid transport protein
MVNPQISYKITDRLSVALGANVFFGKKEFTQFGQLEKDDNLYLRMRTSY